MIKILLIPVKTCETGEYQLKCVSWRVFCSFLLWCVLPTTSSAVHLYVNADKYHEIYLTNHIKFVCLVAFNTLAFLTFWLTVPSMGFLVQHTKVIPDCLLVSPRRILEIMLFNMFNIVACFLYLSGLKDINLVSFLFVCIYYQIYLTSSMFLVDAYTCTFINRCKNFRNVIQHELMINESNYLVKAYKSLKISLGPSFVLHYFVSLPNIICYTYWLIDGGSNGYAICLIVSYSILIWNIASLSQECYEELQLTADFLRYNYSNFIDIYYS